LDGVLLPKPREEKEQRLSAGGAKEKYAMIWLFAAVALHLLSLSKYLLALQD
jgi:hypothetical protein